MSTDPQRAIRITGIGATSALGPGVASIRRALAEGRDGIRPVERMDLSALAPVRLGGMVPGAAAATAWALAAVREAWADASLPPWESGLPVPPERIAVVVGTTDGEKGDIAAIGRALADRIGARGVAWTISTACSSSANALGLGRDLLLAGEADLVVAGGVEALSFEMFAGFTSLGVLAVLPCAPFGDTSGTTLGEGAGFAILERQDERPVRERAFLLGYGLSSDAWHETSPDPRGEGIARAMSAALGDAGVTPAEVGYVNAHGTGTAANDDSEWRGIERALGPRAAEIPVTGSKSFFGHAQGAAGVLETLATIVSLEEGLVPPSLRIGRGRRRGPTDLVLFGTPRERSVDVAVSNSAAFGGANAVVTIARRPHGRAASTARTVRLVGSGHLETAAGAPRDEAAITRVAGHLELRGADPSTRFVVAAVAQAVAAAGGKPSLAARDRWGVFGAASRLSAASGKELVDSIEKKGAARASVSAFAKLVLSAPFGAASRLFGMRGPTTTLASEPTGLFAFVYAYRWLRHRDDADVLAVAAVDERGTAENDETRDAEEGAACVLLSARESDEPGIVVVSVGTGGTRAHAEAQALARGGRGAPERRFVVEASLAPSLRSLIPVLDAIEALRSGAETALVSGEGRAGAAAILFSRG